jgi:hypothetical protein
VEGVSSPNLDATEGRNHNSATVPDLKYYNLKYRRDSRLNWDKPIIIKYGKALQRDLCGSYRGFDESVQHTGEKTRFHC